MTGRSMRAAGVLRLTVGAVLLGSLSHANDPMQDKALKAAVVPEADLLVLVDAAGWRQTPIQRKIDAIQADVAAKATPGNQASQMQVRLDKFVATMGIAKEDLEGLVVSGRVRGLDALQGPRTPQLAFQQLGLLASFRLAKPLTVAKVRLALSDAAAEGGIELMFEKGEYKGAALLSVVRPDQPGKTLWMPREFTVALFDGGTAGCIGNDADIRAALDRVVAGTPASFMAPMKTAQDANAQGALTRVFFIPGDAMRANAKESATRMQGQNPMFAGAMQAVGGLQSVVLGAKGSDKVSLQLSGAFASAQDALQMKTMVDAMVLGMGKMMLMQAVGRPIPLIESLTSRQEGSTVALVADLTEEDCRALVELQMKGRQTIPGGPGVPAGGPPGGPAGIPAAAAK